LGPQPLANALPASAEACRDELFFPLDLFVCRSCFLVQLLDVVDPEVLFRDYLYVSGTSTTMARHFAAYADEVKELQRLGPDDLVVEIASNDGVLLEHFHRAGIRTLGVEPALNVAEIARGKGLETRTDFFSLESAEAIRTSHGPAHAVMANNVLAHVDDTSDFLRGCRALLHEDGVVVIEVPYLGEMLERLEYDTIYHEHLCYFSTTAILPMFAGAGLSIVAIEDVPVHGGSIRIFSRRRDLVPQHAAEVLSRAEDERLAGLADVATYERFGQAVVEGRFRVREAIRAYRARGLRVAAYGAPAKGNTLLNYCGIGPEDLDYIVDRNPLKVGRLSPGTHIPVLDVEALRRDPHDALMVLAWNFANEILAQESWLRERGADFFVPIPHPQVIS
jgi:hypothetical protein